MSRIKTPPKKVVFHPAQSVIASDTHRFRVLCCGRRFGKTFLATWEMIAKALSNKDLHICYIAPTFQQARDICWVELVKNSDYWRYKINETRLEIMLSTVKGGRSKIYLRGWESVETLRGQKFDFLVLDEVASMRYFDTSWEEVLRPTLTDTKGQAMFISTPKGFNHFYNIFNKEAQDPDYKSFHFTTYDNPHMPQDEIEKAKLELPADRFAQEYMADFRHATGLVFKEFDRERHLFSDPSPATPLLPNSLTAYPQFVQKLLGIDFGYTNPTAMVFIKKDYDNNYWVFDEWYKSQQTDDQILERASSFHANAVYPDPEAPDKIRSLRGLPIREVNKGKGSIIAGCDKIRNLFTSNRLFIHRRCKNLIWELENYSYDEDVIGKAAELPLKENDHAIDALRYIISMNAPTINQRAPRPYIPNNSITGY